LRLLRPSRLVFERKRFVKRKRRNERKGERKILKKKLDKNDFFKKIYIFMKFRFFYFS